MRGDKSGEVPKKMLAQVIREDRMGEPNNAFRIEEVDVPELEADEVMVRVMAAGVNYNGVFAAMGKPVNVIELRKKSGDTTHFHIAGSDASGIVLATGKDVKNLRVGDEVVLHCGVWDNSCPFIRGGGDPTLSNTFRIWGYETNWGSFAELTKVRELQCMPKAQHLSWEESAVTTLVGATAYKMLTSWQPHHVEPGDVVLIWGGAGGLGSMAIQIVKEMKGIPVAVTSGAEKMEFCKRLGAAACIDRTKFDHWGPIPDAEDKRRYDRWRSSLVAFARAIHDSIGEKRNPRIVFEHPGYDTFPTSLFVCNVGGMVVTCGATTGYIPGMDIRYLWMRQKRIQGSHFANREQALAFNQMVIEGKIDPCLSKSYSFEETPLAHQLLRDNLAPLGKTAISIGSAVG